MSLRRDTGMAVRGAARILAACALLGLSGCAGEGLGDLESYVAEILDRPGQRPEELPVVEPYVAYAYKSAELLDPFEPFFVEPPEVPEDQSAGSGVSPDFNRNREDLESHPLDALRMMGTLAQEEQVWGIIRSPDGVIHRIQTGNYLGRNHGKIMNIDDESIDLMEIVPDGGGGWTEREAALALVE